MSRIRFYNYYFLKTAVLTIVFLYANTFTSFSQETRSRHIHHPEYPESDIYVITNRQVDISDSGFIFPNQVSNDPSLAFFRINSSCIDSIRVTKLDSTSFLSEILDIKKQDWVLFLHGDSEPFEHAVLEGLNIQNSHKVRVIIFSWPSKSLTLSSLKNLENSYRNIVKSSNHFNSVIRTMYCLRNFKTDFFKENKLSLFAHSLGNWYLENMVNKNLLSDSPSLLFDNVIINASAVDQKNHKKWVEQLDFQKNVYITYNKHDFNLLGLRIFYRRGIKLGEKVRSPLANNAVYCNFTKSVGFRIHTETTHTYFIGKIMQSNNNIRHFYFNVLHGLKPDLADETRFIKRGESISDVFIR